MSCKTKRHTADASNVSQELRQQSLTQELLPR